MIHTVRNPIREVGQGTAKQGLACAAPHGHTAIRPHSPGAQGSRSAPPRPQGGQATKPCLPSVKPSTQDRSRKKQSFSRANTLCHTPPSLPAAAVPPKFSTGSQPSEHCSSIRQWLLTHTTSAHSPTHTSNMFLQLRVRGKQLILQKHPSQSILKHK